MNQSTSTVFASALILSVAGPASSALSAELERDIQSAAGLNSNVFVDIDGDTVTLTGSVKDKYALQAIEQVAGLDGAETVIINILQKA